MKKIVARLYRGVLSLLVLAVLVSTISFVIQSCIMSVERVDSGKDLARDNFVTLAKSVAPQLRSLEERSISVMAVADKSPESERALRREAKKKLTPLVKSGQALLEAYGFTEEVFEGTGMNKEDPHALYVVFAILKVEELQRAEVSFSNILLNSCTDTAYASKFWDCVKVAIGMDIGIEIFRRSKLQTISGKKMLIKMFTKIGARYLGYVGVAIATYDFIDCMWLSE